MIWTFPSSGRARVAAALLCAAGTVSAWAAPSPPRPRLVCPEPVCRFTEKDLEAGSIRHVFRLRNEGGVSVEILRVESRCGCTDVDLSYRVIPPGAESSLSVTLNLRGREGGVERVLRVHSTDPDHPVLDLRFEGTIASEVEVQPLALLLGTLPEGGSITQSVDVVFAPEITNRVVDVTPDSENFHAWFSEVEAGRKYRIHVANRAEASVPGGFLRAAVAVRTATPLKHPLAIPVRALVMDELMVSPRELVILPEEQGPLTLYAAVRPGRIREFRITEVRPPHARIRADVRPIEDGYQIRMRGVPVDPSLNGLEMVLKTDVPTRPEIRIPFRYEGPVAAPSTVPGGPSR